MRMLEGLLYLNDFSTEERALGMRTWGIQILIVRNGEIFIQDDPDALNREEVQVVKGEPVIPELKLRWNSSSGGKKEGEDLRKTAFREMNEELGIVNEGRLVVMDELPLVAAGQIKMMEGKGVLTGVILMAFEPTETEWERLKDKGVMRPTEEVLGMVEEDVEMVMRPIFRIALQVAARDREGDLSGLELLIGLNNTLVVEKMITECGIRGVELKMGIFEGVNDFTQIYD